MTNLDSILKSRDITLPTKVSLVKAMVFPVVMYRCESWTVKKAEHRRIDALNCGVGEDSWESLDSLCLQSILVRNHYLNCIKEKKESNETVAILTEVMVFIQIILYSFCILKTQASYF